MDDKKFKRRKKKEKLNDKMKCRKNVIDLFWRRLYNIFSFISEEDRFP